MLLSDCLATSSSVLHVKVKDPVKRTMSREVLISSNRTGLVKRGRYLEYFTIGYNSLEGLIAVLAGLIFLNNLSPKH